MHSDGGDQRGQPLVPSSTLLVACAPLHRCIPVLALHAWASVRGRSSPCFARAQSSRPSVRMHRGAAAALTVPHFGHDAHCPPRPLCHCARSHPTTPLHYQQPVTQRSATLPQLSASRRDDGQRAGRIGRSGGWPLHWSPSQPGPRDRLGFPRQPHSRENKQNESNDRGAHKRTSRHMGGGSREWNEATERLTSLQATHVCNQTDDKGRTDASRRWVVLKVFLVHHCIRCFQSNTVAHQQRSQKKGCCC